MLDEAKKSDISLFCYEADGTKPIKELLVPNVKSISVIVGSEGGFSPKEAQLAKENGLSLCGLGNRILRCETAPLFVLSCLSFYYELGI
jgi:16S rRNA (uracil1498-N3)-methyltransferase